MDPYSNEVFSVVLNLWKQVTRNSMSSVSCAGKFIFLSFFLSFDRTIIPPFLSFQAGSRPPCQMSSGWFYLGRLVVGKVPPPTPSWAVKSLTQKLAGPLSSDVVAGPVGSFAAEI